MASRIVGCVGRNICGLDFDPTEKAVFGSMLGAGLSSLTCQILLGQQPFYSFQEELIKAVFSATLCGIIEGKSLPLNEQATDVKFHVKRAIAIGALLGAASSQCSWLFPK